MWSQYYKMKMNKEMKKSAVIEDAFQRIRSQTAINDVQEIVYRYLNREQTYAQLLQAVSEQEAKLDRIKKSTEVKKEFIAKLKIEHNALVKSSAPAHKVNPKSADATESEIIKLSNEIEFLEKELSTLTDRRKKFHLVSD
jgi:cell division protein FtsB